MKYLYAVMRLNTTIKVVGESVKLEGCEGYLPVFKTKEEAEEHTDNGKYPIMPVKRITEEK